MRNLRWICVPGIGLLGALATLATLTACGRAPGPAAENRQQDPGDKSAHVLLDSAKRPMERAQQVDDVMREQKRAMDEKLGEAER